jgi:beta-glucosidase
MTLDVPALLAALTLEEKAALLDGADFWHTQPIERLGIPGVMVTDGPHGLRKQTGESDHVGLNDSVPATCFPPAAGLASSWNPELLWRIGEALGRECRAEQVAVLLGPGVNMKRSQLRVFLRGPAARRRPRRGPGERAAEHRGGRLAQALRRQ